MVGQPTEYEIPAPPATIPGTPRLHTLTAGSVLRRVHGEYAADAFNPTAQPSRLRGGRFDSLDGSYAYTYLGYDDEGAIAETLARDLPLDGSPRLVPRKRIAGRSITSAAVTRDLAVLVLHGAALSQIGAGLWLTKSEADQYERTRAWASWLLAQLPDIDGFEYRCRHDEDRLALALFDESPNSRPRAAGALHAQSDTMPLDRDEGLLEVARVLAEHNAGVEPL